MAITYQGEMDRDDLLNAFASHTFTEDPDGDFTIVSFLNGSSVVVGYSKKMEVDDAYRSIKVDLLGDKALTRLTTTQRDDLTDPPPALEYFQTTDDNVELHYEGEFKVVGGTEWKIRPSQTVTTTDATQTTIDSFTLDDEETYMVQIFVVGTKDDGSDRCGVIKQAVLYRDGGGNATLQGNVSTTLEEYSDLNWDVDITVSGNDVRASVTGVAATTITWKCSMQFIEQ